MIDAAQVIGDFKLYSALSAIGAALLSYLVASMKFGKEKRWELKHEAYKDIMNDLWEIFTWSSEFSYDEYGTPLVATQEQDTRYREVKHSFKRHVLLGELIISKRAINLLYEFECSVSDIWGGYSDKWEDAQMTNDRRELEHNTAGINISIASDIGTLAKEYMTALRKESRKDLHWPRWVYSILMFFIKDYRLR